MKLEMASNKTENSVYQHQLKVLIFAQSDAKCGCSSINSLNTMCSQNKGKLSITNAYIMASQSSSIHLWLG